jgi:hypothetical protein
MTEYFADSADEVARTNAYIVELMNKMWAQGAQYIEGAAAPSIEQGEKYESTFDLSAVLSWVDLELLEMDF